MQFFCLYFDVKLCISSTTDLTLSILANCEIRLNALLNKAIKRMLRVFCQNISTFMLKFYNNLLFLLWFGVVLFCI